MGSISERVSNLRGEVHALALRISDGSSRIGKTREIQCSKSRPSGFIGGCARIHWGAIEEMRTLALSQF